MEEKEKCDCGGEQTSEAHTCPYMCELYDNDEFTCFCCDDCTRECAMDV